MRDFFRRFIRSAILAAANSAALPHRWRPTLLRRAGLAVGESCHFLGSLSIHGLSQISVGSHSFVNREVYIEADAAVTIGDGVSIGPRVCLLTSTHPIGSVSRRAGPSQALQIAIGDGSWLGAGVYILPGVTIAPGCVVAAGAVVVGATEPNGLYAGVPAVRKRDLNESIA